MPTLVKNAWINGKGWGPGFGNADQVPADVAALIDADAWDEAPPAPAPAPIPEVVDGIVTAVPEPAPGSVDNALPTDKPSLLAFAAEHGLDINKRLTYAKLRSQVERLIDEAPS